MALIIISRIITLRANRSERRIYLQAAITFDERRQDEIKNRFPA